MLFLADFKSKLSRDQTVAWTMEPSVEMFWCFEMRASREEIWAYISDTSRFNRELGFAPRQQVEKDGKVLVHTTMMGFTQEWEEQPWTWLSGETITSVRHYLKGLAHQVQSVFHIEEAGDSRRVYIYFGWRPVNFFWRLFIRATSPIVYKKFAANFARIDTHLQNEKQRKENAFRAPAPALSESAVKKMNEARTALIQRGIAESVAESLCQFIATGDDLDVETIRVLPLAKRWEIEAKDLLVACLHATRLGLLKITWEVICPHCRGSRFSAASLGDIPEGSNCGVCEIDFTTNEAESIEVVFHVHPAIRKIEKLLYCAAEPAKKSHIKIQQILKPGQVLEISAALKDGLYRARSVGSKSECKVEVSRRNSTAVVELTSGHLQAGAPAKFRFTNSSERDSVFVLEELWWETTALRPSQVLSLPDFRDLFAEEHLSSNVKLFLGDQAILFSDIVGSTKFYNEVGDAKAFKEVRAHFQEVFEDVRAHHGVVVKTIGDAVMASFPSAHEALAAAVAIQERFDGQRDDTRIRLRISVHSGPVIAVHLNTGIDYFGNTVNFAAKIQGCAGAGEIALSELAHQTHLAAAAKGFKFPIEKRKSGVDSVGNVEVYVMIVDRMKTARAS
jgi:hypothetical protein